MRRFLLAFLCLMLLTPRAFAQDYPDLSKHAKLKRTGSSDVAIVVAIEDYLLLPDVQGAVRNASDWEVFFRHSLGVKNVHVLVNAGASREDILDATRRALVDAKPSSTVWFLFIGHGAATEDGKDGVLVGMDAKGTASSLEARGVKRTELLDLLQSGKQKNTVAFFDACFSGRSGTGGALAPGVQPVVAVPKLKKSGNLVVLSAARADQVAGSLANQNRPAFSYFLLGAMRGWADAPGDDGKLDGSITAEEAEQYVARQLRSIPGRTQVPDLDGNRRARFTAGAREASPYFYSRSPTSGSQPQKFEKVTKGQGWERSEPAKPSTTTGAGRTVVTQDRVEVRLGYKGTLIPLHLKSEPEGAEIYYWMYGDRKQRIKLGVTSRTIDLPPGKHTFELRKKGFLTGRKTILLEGKEGILTVQLRKDEVGPLMIAP